MPDLTLPVRHALFLLAELGALRVENAVLRRKLAEERDDSRSLRLQLRLSRYVTRWELPPLRTTTAARIPSQRPSPEGVRRATAPRSSRRRP